MVPDERGEAGDVLVAALLQVGLSLDLATVGRLVGIAFTADRSASSDAGSVSGSSAAKCSRPSPSAVICAFVGNRAATSR
ncbi:hypothetical protein [Kitasatospora sp. CB01950]|uniref:hypothetical protein n=1 Tax=Kitasatospora sp. CB01950 TaxID=1703930 RepID=UPI00093DEEE5|nr:hypothetical protein [Kitasatospora sp. CB01950]OKJ09218.1 hypothetical protein AMK19_17740 [Kitasatospora sp. CB01950]